MLIVIADLESTGLIPRLHEPWEVAFGRDDGEHMTEHVWRWLAPHIEDADPMALRLNHYYQRTAALTKVDAGEGMVACWSTAEGAGVDAPEPYAWVTQAEAALQMAQLSAGAVMVAANPKFDLAEMLAPWMTERAAPPAWFFRPVCIETLMAGLLGIPVESWPWDHTALSLLLGVDAADYDRHTALGDVRFARAELDAWRARHTGSEQVAVSAPATKKRRVARSDSPAGHGEPIIAASGRVASPDPYEKRAVALPPEPAAPTPSEQPVPVAAELVAEAATTKVPDGFPEAGNTYRCYDCGKDIVDTQGNPDLRQAQFSFAMFQDANNVGITLDRECHQERTKMTRG